MCHIGFPHSVQPVHYCFRVHVGIEGKIVREKPLSQMRQMLRATGFQIFLAYIGHHRRAKRPHAVFIHVPLHENHPLSTK